MTPDAEILRALSVRPQVSNRATPGQTSEARKTMRLTLTLVLIVLALGSGCGTPGLSQSKGETPYKPKAGSNQADSAVVESYLAVYREMLSR